MATATKKEDSQQLIDTVVTRFPPVGLETCRKIVDKYVGSQDSDVKTDILLASMQIGNYMQGLMGMASLLGPARDEMTRRGIKKILDDEDRTRLAIAELALLVGCKFISAHAAGYRDAAEGIVRKDLAEGGTVEELTAGLDAMIAEYEDR